MGARQTADAAANRKQHRQQSQGPNNPPHIRAVVGGKIHGRRSGSNRTIQTKLAVSWRVVPKDSPTMGPRPRQLLPLLYHLTIRPAVLCLLLLCQSKPL
jgi:hypothetical protein